MILAFRILGWALIGGASLLLGGALMRGGAMDRPSELIVVIGYVLGAVLVLWANRISKK